MRDFFGDSIRNFFRLWARKCFSRRQKGRRRGSSLGLVTYKKFFHGGFFFVFLAFGSELEINLFGFISSHLEMWGEILRKFFMMDFFFFRLAAGK